MQHLQPKQSAAAEHGPPLARTESRLTAISSLMQTLEPDPSSAPCAAQVAHENRLVQARLGVCSGLFAALRAKHPPTATHSLRVALGCSTWAWAIEMHSVHRDILEVAALLHDVGKIGVPDQVLLKPNRLTDDEILAVGRQHAVSVEILGHCCAEREVVDIVRYASAWYDGSRGNHTVRGESIPLGARMLAIVDAYDSMTNDHVYRRAYSRERAVAELFAYAGTQFDPDLVKSFCHVLTSDWPQLQAGVISRWLRELRPETSAVLWSGMQASPPPAAAAPEATKTGGMEQLFYAKLLENMHDGVAFVEQGMKLRLWNRAAERLTGLMAEDVLGETWTPALIRMRDEKGEAIGEADCPVAYTMSSGVQTLRRLLIAAADGRKLLTDAHVVPVLDDEGAVLGATLVMHDASSEATLEERVATLYEKATLDPLTKVANRAEFDRSHREYIEQHTQRHESCCLVICDLDFFKRINDVHGHQAGDDALIAFAALLRQHSGPGDLPARYGGEEFCWLLGDCDVHTAMKRAEALRHELAATAQPSLGGRCLTASFGLTELLPRDSADAMLRRADRALLQAKARGRNQVICLGRSGAAAVVTEEKRGWWSRLFGDASSQVQFERSLVSPAPLNLAIEKLKGFIADNHGQIVSISGDRVKLSLTRTNLEQTRRASDRSIPFEVEVRFSDLPEELQQQSKAGQNGGTFMDVVVRARNRRDRRRRDIAERSVKVFLSLKAYLMAQEYSPNLALHQTPAVKLPGEKGEPDSGR